MPGLVPGIHVLLNNKRDVDGRDKPGHDELKVSCWWRIYAAAALVVFFRLR
jgi:hypothetical protein